MKKAYEPLNMVMNGRYAVLYGKLDPTIQKEVLSRMAGLIEEERDYEDKGNYGHFCNILPTIAIDDVLQRNGKSPEEAFELISTHMWAALNPERFRRLSKLPFFLSVMRKIIPLGFKYGVLERFGPMFCRSDIINYGNLHDIDFIRTKTLCQGGDCCDFRFVKHRRGEVWERTKSI